MRKKAKATARKRPGRVQRRKDLLGTVYTVISENGIDGASMRPLFSDPEKGRVKRTEKDLYFHRYASGYPHSAVIEGHYKLIKFWKTGKEELYDLAKDVGETHDLAAEQPEKLKELDRKLMAYLTKMDAEILDPQLPKGKIKIKKDDDDDDK